MNKDHIGEYDSCVSGRDKLHGFGMKRPHSFQVLNKLIEFLQTAKNAEQMTSGRIFLIQKHKGKDIFKLCRIHSKPIISFLKESGLFFPMSQKDLPKIHKAK